MQKLVLAVGTALGLVLFSGGAALAQPAGPTVAPAVAQGQPALNENSAVGYHIWIDGDRIHLRTTDPGGDASLYTGRITTDGHFRDVDLIQPEDDDWAVGSGDTLEFHFHTANQVDGVSFTAADAGRITFHLMRDGHEIRTDRIYLGAAGAHPPGNPFSIYI